MLDDNLEFFKNKRVGLITNPTGTNSDFLSTVKIIKQHLNLTTLFSPEHGFRGDLQAGVRLDDYVDDETGCMVYSLYGKNKIPTAKMLKNIDVLCFDIQDVGARFYTYIYTMAYAMIAAKEHGKEFVVFDRPNPVGGVKLEGNILDMNFKSFVGNYPILQRHGLTVGELAMLFNDEYEINVDLKVIKMSGWKRNMLFKDTLLPWIAPSPNLPTPESTINYLCTCIFEGTNVSEGRGTTRPFSIVGAPWLDVELVLLELERMDFQGVKFRKLYFTPSFSKHQGELCAGIEIYVNDYELFEPVYTGYSILKIIEKSHTEFEFRAPFKEGHNPMINLLNGSDFLKNDSLSLDEIKTKFIKDKRAFSLVKERYHLYE